ncbi:MAG TPA: patatin-like phospholipase family protein [Desulfobaccales bacterium]|nr:patatin-like phospholipase family protein [Desulfobaccales bacterium]
MFSAIEKDSLRQAHSFILALLTALVFLSQGCMSLPVRHPLPENLLDQVQVADLPGIRDWGDVHSENLEQSAVESIRQEMAANRGKLEPEMTFLALSGGGGDGAFGAGILCGWTAAGTRPRFKLVTGISTGALIAPFAFLGPEYDARLKAVYTTMSDKDVYTVTSVATLVLKLGKIEAAANTRPLAELIERLFDENMLRAIAASNRPGALKLFRQVLLASASTPIALNPVYIKVKAAGQEYDEMHVDGGVKAQVMLYGEAISFYTTKKKLGPLMPYRPCKLYIIRNAQVSPEYESIKPHIWAIGPRAMTSMTKSQGTSDLYRIYLLAQRDGIDYNLAFIPLDFKTKRNSEFDTTYMNEEFELAYNLARSGYKWSKYPPGFEPEKSKPTTAKQVQP